MNDSSLPLDSERSKPFASTDARGHRNRMRERLLQYGSQSLQDYEILEMLLFLAIHRRDTKPLAKTLINRFGSLSNVIGASKEQLHAAGLSSEIIGILQFPHMIANRLINPDIRHRPFIERWQDILTYLNATKHFVSGNLLRVLYLNAQKRIISDETFPDRGRDCIPIIIEQALDCYAVSLISVHHLSAKTLSKAQQHQEEQFFSALMMATGPFDMKVSDHIINIDEQYIRIIEQE